MSWMYQKWRKYEIYLTPFSPPFLFCSPNNGFSDNMYWWCGFPFLRLLVIFHLVRIHSIHSSSHNSFTVLHFQSRRLSQVLPHPLEIMTITTLCIYTYVSVCVTIYVTEAGRWLIILHTTGHSCSLIPVRWEHSWMNEWVAADIFVMRKTTEEYWQCIMLRHGTWCFFYFSKPEAGFTITFLSLHHK